MDFDSIPNKKITIKNYYLEDIRTIVRVIKY